MVVAAVAVAPVVAAAALVVVAAAAINLELARQAVAAVALAPEIFSGKGISF